MATCPSHLLLFKLQVSRQRDETGDKAQSFKPLLRPLMLVTPPGRAAGALEKGRELPIQKQLCESPQRPFFSQQPPERAGTENKEIACLNSVLVPNVTFGDTILKEENQL